MSFATRAAMRSVVHHCGIALFDCIGLDCHNDLEHFSVLGDGDGV